MSVDGFWILNVRDLKVAEIRQHVPIPLGMQHLIKHVAYKSDFLIGGADVLHRLNGCRVQRVVLVSYIPVLWLLISPDQQTRLSLLPIRGTPASRPPHPDIAPPAGMPFVGSPYSRE